MPTVKAVADPAIAVSRHEALVRSIIPCTGRPRPKQGGPSAGIDKGDVQDDEWAIPNVTFKGVPAGESDVVPPGPDPSPQRDGVDRPHRPGRHARHVRRRHLQWGDWRWWIMFAVATTVVIAAGWFIVDIAVEYHDRTQRLRKRLDRRQVVGQNCFDSSTRARRPPGRSATRPYRLTNSTPARCLRTATSAPAGCQVPQVVGATHRRTDQALERTRPGVVLLAPADEPDVRGTANSISVGRTGRAPPGLPAYGGWSRCSSPDTCSGAWASTRSDVSASRRSRLKCGITQASSETATVAASVRSPGEPDVTVMHDDHVRLASQRPVDDRRRPVERPVVTVGGEGDTQSGWWDRRLATTQSRVPASALVTSVAPRMTTST